jgi:hypothetical protein
LYSSVQLAIQTHRSILRLAGLGPIYGNPGSFVYTADSIVSVRGFRTA